MNSHVPRAADPLSSGIGRANGPNRQAPYGKWFRYPAGLSGEALSLSLTELDIGVGSVVLDPFAGVGTVGVAVASAGGEFLGVEAHPLVASIAATKFRSVSCSTNLVEAAKATITAARRNAKVATEEPTPESQLVVGSFAPDVRADLVALRTAILRSRSPWREHLRVALSATLRDVANVRVSWPYQRPGIARVPTYSDAISRFIGRCTLMMDDIRAHPIADKGIVIEGDSRASATFQDSSTRATGCISSPPYLNNFDYMDAVRLESYFWRDWSTWSELLAHARSTMVRATSHQTTDRLAAASRERIARYPIIGPDVLDLADRLAVERQGRPRGKEYDRMLLCYVEDIVSVLTAMKTALRPGARCAWTIGDSAPYGVYIDTPALVGALAETVGYSVEATRTIRERGRRWQGNGTRHSVALAEKLLLFRLAD